MTPENQEALALVVVGVAAAALLAGWVRKRLRGPTSSCPGDCSCTVQGEGKNGTSGGPVESAAGKR